MKTGAVSTADAVKMWRNRAQNSGSRYTSPNRLIAASEHQTKAWDHGCNARVDEVQYLVSSESLTAHRGLLKDSTYKKRGAVTLNKLSDLLIKDHVSALYTSLNTSL